MNNLFRGIPFSHEDKIHEHIQESLLLRRRTKGNFSCCFRSFLHNKTVFNIITLIFREQDFSKRRAFLLTHPVDNIYLSGEPEKVPTFKNS